MAVADKTIDPRILDNARKEFLENGFEKASLKKLLVNILTGTVRLVLLEVISNHII